MKYARVRKGKRKGIEVFDITISLRYIFYVVSYI